MIYCSGATGTCVYTTGFLANSGALCLESLCSVCQWEVHPQLQLHTTCRKDDLSAGWVRCCLTYHVHDGMSAPTGRKNLHPLSREVMRRAVTRSGSLVN